MLWRNCHYNKHLQSSWNKYGGENFLFEIIDYAFDWEELNTLEIYWIRTFRSVDPRFGFNRDSGGNKGKHVSLQTRQLLSRKSKGRKFSPEECRSRSIRQIGRVQSEKTRQLISEKNRGKNHTKTRRENYFGNRNAPMRKVECVETSEIFESCVSAGKHFGVTKQSIISACRGRLARVRGKTFRYVD